MTPSTRSGKDQGMVRNLRSIRDQLNQEIKDMTFEQERAYLDQLLAARPAPQPDTHQSGAAA